MLNNKRVILLTGSPGAGKGTQAEILSKKHGWHTFSVGQLLRDANEPEITAIMNKGELLPAEQTVRLVVDEVSRSTVSTVITDGFPRRLDQAKVFDQVTEGKGLRVDIIVLVISQDESWRRLKSRGRPDDERSVWENRWKVYHEETVPSIEYYRERGNLAEIDGEGTVEEVTARIEEALNEA